MQLGFVKMAAVTALLSAGIWTQERARERSGFSINLEVSEGQIGYRTPNLSQKVRSESVLSQKVRSECALRSPEAKA